MSTTVHCDVRTRALQSSDLILQNAAAHLGAARSQISCGQVEVHTTKLDAAQEERLVQGMKLDYGVDELDTSKLDSELGRKVAKYSAADVLGEWKPDVSAPTLHVDNGQIDDHKEMTLVADFECAALDGARLTLMKVDDGLGGSSFQVGLDVTLFDAEGNWKKESHKNAYENFLAQTLLAQKAAEKAARRDAPLDRQLSTALHAAGLEAKARKNLPGGVKHTVVVKKDEVAPPKVRTAGGGKPNE